MSDQLPLRSLDSYQVREVVWLDKPFQQRGAFHLLAGRKGSCKGTYVCGLAARVTTGELYGVPKKVIVVTSEDSIELDFKPRVLAAGGDPTFIHIVTGDFRLPDDLGRLRDTALELGNVGLIVIDPVGNHLGGVDTDREGLVREAIAALNPIADELDCMIIGVRHLGKDSGRGALSAVLGSTAWVDVPRCVILMATDDEDDRLFHAQVVAGNRGPKNHGRVFGLKLVDVPPAREITLLVPEGESTKDIETLLANGGADARKSSNSAKARELILDLLDQNTTMESSELDARVAAEIGVTPKTAQNQRSRLKAAGLIAFHPDRDEQGAITRWIVRRTNAARPGPDSNDAPNEEPLDEARSRPSSLERVSTGPSTPPPGYQSEDQAWDQADPEARP